MQGCTHLRFWGGVALTGVHAHAGKVCAHGRYLYSPAASEPQVHMTCVTAIITFGAAAVKRVEVAPLG